jgi:aspartate/methionine/tyrosine aminotransferase
VVRKKLLPPGNNLFQHIKAVTAKAEQSGIKITRLSIGQPSGPAFLEARVAASQAVMSDKESMHEYQDNGCPGVTDFARRFVQCHVKTDLASLSPGTVDFLPVPGIKPTIDIVIKSLGSWVSHDRGSVVFTMTEPGYPTPADACAMVKGVHHCKLKLLPDHGFLFDTEALDGELGEDLGERDMIMINFPHNPSGAIAPREFLHRLCAYCEKRGVRLFNDNAYAMMAHDGDFVTLTDIALSYPGLNWAEAFSASKGGNNTGWRIAAVVGSPEFMDDIKQINGKMNSGIAAPLAAGIVELYEKYPERIKEAQQMYKLRLDALLDVLSKHGMLLATAPKAGFFALFHAPRRAFGQDVENGEAFNQLMINKKGLVGVHFGPYIRYSVATLDVPANAEWIEGIFREADVSY